MRSIVSLVGMTFGKLLVVEYSGKNKYKKTLWLCECECGNKKTIMGASLKNERTQSCGCLEHENRLNNIIPGGNESHLMSRTRIYRIWSDMKKRCNDASNEDYGGRGISYESTWEDFVDFYNDMGEGYEEHLTIDRINVDGNYTKINCRWITNREQQNNKRRTVKVIYKAKEYTLKDLYNELSPDIGYNTIKNRIVYGKWSVEKAFVTPIDKSRRHNNG